MIYVKPYCHIDTNLFIQFQEYKSRSYYTFYSKGLLYLCIYLSNNPERLVVYKVINKIISICLFINQIIGEAFSINILIVTTRKKSLIDTNNVTEVLY